MSSDYIEVEIGNQTCKMFLPVGRLKEEHSLGLVIIINMTFFDSFKFNNHSFYYKVIVNKCITTRNRTCEKVKITGDVSLRRHIYLCNKTYLNFGMKLHMCVL